MALPLGKQGGLNYSPPLSRWQNKLSTTVLLSQGDKTNSQLQSSSLKVTKQTLNYSTPLSRWQNKLSTTVLLSQGDKTNSQLQSSSLKVTKQTLNYSTPLSRWQNRLPTWRTPRWPSGKASASRAEDPEFESRLCRDFFGIESYQWLKNWHSSGYPAKAPGVIGSALGLVGLVSVYCDWVRKKVWSATSISVWQQVKLSEQIRPWDTLACCWDVKQSTNKQTNSLPDWLHTALTSPLPFPPSNSPSPSQYTDTRPTSPSSDPLTPGAWQGSH